MFGFLKRRLFRRMTAYVDAIKVVTYVKLWGKLAANRGEAEAKLLSAAVVNRVFASAASPVHADIAPTLIDELAADFLRNEQDSDLLRGITMSLRTLMVLGADARNREAMNRVSDTVQWVKTLIPLPSEAPSPDMMRSLAATLQSRYLEQ